MPHEPGKLASLLGTFVLVVGVTVGALRLCDRLGRGLTDGDLVPVASVADLERRAGERLALPAYFPETLVWPPARIVATGGRRPTAALVAFAGRGEPGERLLFAQAFRGSGPIPARLLPDATVLDEEDAPPLPRATGARLARLLGEAGAVWYELALAWSGAPVLLRLRGSREELLRLAATLHREGPRAGRAP